MNQIAANPVLQAYVVTAVVLGFNLLVLANNTALSRGRANEVVNPEDKKLNPKSTVVGEAGNDKTARYQRAHRNALENLPLFLVTGYVLTLTAVPLWAAATMYGVFAGARILHSICYVAGAQPWRTLGFVIGTLSQVSVLGYLLYAAFA